MYRNVFRVLPGACDAGDVRRRDQRSAASGRRPTSRRCGLRPIEAYARRLARLSRSSPCAGRCAARIGIGCLLSGGLDSSSVSVLAARALGENNQRLAAFTGVPRQGFDGALPAGHYGDETPYVDAIAAKAGNIDVTYIRNDEHDDFAELERFFIALEGPVRNPTNLGWVLGLMRERARARPARAARRPPWQFHHQLERLVAGARASQARAAAHRRIVSGSFIYRQHVLFARAVRCENFSSSRCCRERRRRSPAWQSHSPIRPDFAAAMDVDRARAK